MFAARKDITNCTSKEGAINLSFPDIAIASLEKLIPAKNMPILAYCNNNFTGAEIPFASLSLSTINNLDSFRKRVKKPFSR